MTATQFRERLFSPVGLHLVGFCVLAVATLLLGVRVGLDWRATSSSNVDAVAGRQAELRKLQIQTAPLRGLDKKVGLSRKQIDTFYDTRIPPSWSSVLERMGEISVKGPVRLGRVQYTPTPGSGDLTEIRMDAGVSGDYPAIMRFVNGLERSQTFFIIRAMQLTGQQSGAVNLRLEVSTWLRPEDAPPASAPTEDEPMSAPTPASTPHSPVGSTAPGAVRMTPVNANDGEGL